MGLNLADIAAADREVTALVDGQPRVFPIRGMVSVAQVARLLELEGRMQAAVAESASPEVFVGALTDAHAMVMEIIRERTPDAPDLELDMMQVAALMGYIAGNETVAAAVADTLAPASADEERPTDEDRGEEEAQEGAVVPLASARPSPTPSSSSDDSMAGGPSGGIAPPGPASEPISVTHTG